MATVTKPKKKKTPSRIQVVDEDLIGVAIEWLKESHYWEQAERYCKEGDAPAILAGYFKRIVWQRDDLQLRGLEHGVRIMNRQGEYADILWSNLVDELEESVTNQVNENESPPAEIVGANGKKKPPTGKRAKPANPPASVLADASSVTDPGEDIEPPGLTGTTVPAGIARHDPDAVGAHWKCESCGQRVPNDPVPTKCPGCGECRWWHVTQTGDLIELPEIDNPAPPTAIDSARSRTFRTPAGEACEVNVDAIEPNPYQPRQTFPEQEIAELAVSIETHGQLQRVLLRLKPGTSDRYQLADGERRWRACKHMGRRTVLAEIQSIDDRQMAELALEANDARKDLTAIERAAHYRRMIQEFGLSHEELAARLSSPDGKRRSKGYVSNLVRLLDLPAEWQARVAAGELSPSHAELLVPLRENPKDLARIEKKLAAEGGAPSLTRFSALIETVRGTMRTAGSSVPAKPWPKPNKFGVYTNRYQTLKIPFPKSLKAHAAIFVIEVRRNDWRLGYDYGASCMGCSTLPSKSGSKYASRAAAVEVAVANMVRDFRDPNSEDVSKARGKRIAELVAQWHAKWKAENDREDEEPVYALLAIIEQLGDSVDPRTAATRATARKLVAQARALLKRIADLPKPKGRK